VVRTEDTDQNRFVTGAEQYIFDCLNWCGITPDESSLNGGPYGPYRQSERKALYREFAERLVAQGNAYYAFDTPEELEQMRERLRSSGSESLQYDHRSRMQMNNSLQMTAEETLTVLQSGKPYVIRIKVNPNRILHMEDLIRGSLEFDCAGVDDKVLLKADGMPTYHLAVVVDDHLMKITHAFRGEEWLPSAPVHLLLWEYLFGIKEMPAWAHLPLILKPDGHGKLSKRDGERLGFPVYAMNWQDPNTGISSPGFRELGFLPEAFINFLALLGWNDGTGKEIFTLDELVETFSIERVHKGGAKFDFEKAKWFNHEWIKRSDSMRLFEPVKEILITHGITLRDDDYLIKVLDMIKERCTLLHDFVQQGSFFFQSPSGYDEASVIPKWDKQKSEFFSGWMNKSKSAVIWDSHSLESEFKQAAADSGIKLGELQMIFRIMLVGSKIGPAVFEISGMLGKKDTLSRVEKAIQTFDQKI
jgi:glutamyl-tRNA synthetase